MTVVNRAALTPGVRRRAGTGFVVAALLAGMLAVGDPDGGPVATASPRAASPRAESTVAPPAVAPPAVAPPAVAPPAVVPAPAPVPVAPVPDAPGPVAVPATGLAAAAVEAGEAAAGARTELAVAVLDLATGESAASASAAAPVLTASLSKVVVAVDILDRHRLDGLEVTDSDLDRLTRALGPSDDGAMNALWSRFDGAGAAGRVAARLGLAATTDPDDPSQWGEMAVSAADTVALWEYILRGMPAADRDVLVSAMQAAPALAADGFDQAFGLLDPAVRAAGTAAKQGWMCCFSGTYYIHSAGVVGPDQRFVVALLTQQPRGPGWEAARQELDRIAAATVAPLL